MSQNTSSTSWPQIVQDFLDTFPQKSSPFFQWLKILGVGILGVVFMVLALLAVIVIGVFNLIFRPTIPNVPAVNESAVQVEQLRQKVDTLQKKVEALPSPATK
jgi:hypothetical protein